MCGERHDPARALLRLLFPESGPGNHQRLLGLDLLWSHHGFEIMGEAVHRVSSQGSQSDESGAYLQGVVPVYGRLYGVVRLEDITRRSPEQTIRDGVLGLPIARAGPSHTRSNSIAAYTALAMIP